MAAFFYCAHAAFVIFEPYLSSRALAKVIERTWRPGDRVVIDGEYYLGSSLGFYIRPKVYLLNGRMTGLEFGSHYPDAPPVFIGDRDIEEWWKGRQRVFLFTGAERRPQLERELAPAAPLYVIAASGGKFLLTNQPSPGGQSAALRH